MFPIGATYLFLGITLRIVGFVLPEFKRSRNRISSIFIATGCLEIMLFVLWFFLKVDKSYQFMFSAGIVVIAIPLVLLEANRSYRAYRDYHKIMDGEDSDDRS